MKAIIVHKSSDFDFYRLQGYDIDEILKKKGLTLPDLLFEKSEHEATLMLVEDLLRWKNIGFQKYHRSDIKKDVNEFKKKVEEANLAIVVGGDGTFLETSHYVRETALWGINSHSIGGNCSVGWFCSATRYDIKDKIEDVVEGKAKKDSLNRFFLHLDGEGIEEIVLNEVMVCGKQPSSQVRYKITADERTEEHRNSGMWIATAAGSTSVSYQCGGPMLRRSSKQAVLATMGDRRRNYELQGISVDSPVVIQSCMWDGQIFIDGDYCGRNFHYGSVLEINNSKSPLNVITFGEPKKA